MPVAPATMSRALGIAVSLDTNPRVNADEQAEVKAYRQLHELIQSGEMERASFRAATKCVDAHRYPHDKLSRYQNRLRQLRHWAIVDGGSSNHDY